MGVWFSCLTITSHPARARQQRPVNFRRRAHVCVHDGRRSFNVAQWNRRHYFSPEPIFFGGRCARLASTMPLKIIAVEIMIGGVITSFNSNTANTRLTNGCENCTGAIRATEP